MDSNLATILAALIGLLGAVLAAWISRNGVSKQILLFVIAASGGFLGVALGLLAIDPLVFTPCPIFAPASATITSPTDKSTVDFSETILVSACHTQGKDLWLLVQPSGVSGYYPQDSPVKTSNTGSSWFTTSKEYWTTNAYLGDTGVSQHGRTFTLVVVLADASSSVIFSSYLANSSPMKLPSGVSIVGQPIRVIRK